MEQKAAGRRTKRIRIILWIFALIFFVFIIILLIGVFHGRFNYKYETVEIEYTGLPDGLDGFTIVHISDLHLDSFSKHKKKLIPVIDSINSYEPDIIVNTGDFVTFIWREMTPFTEILASMQSEYGVYAIPGNHDTGIYSAEYNSENYEEHLDKMEDLLNSADHTYLENTSTIISIDTLIISLTGVTTYGMTPNFDYGDVDKAIQGTDSSDFRILLTHDPNHWIDNIQYRNDIDLTLAGHTHGMQIGILMPGFKISPAKLLYPAWNGLYGKNDNYLYVNRGLGTIGLPARIGMPPEITVIKIKGKK
ncbi:MAG: metallophosphoesterase [Bacteroidales bacterium]|nr:metallophosphoesterase [Bacteroidales bacterium]